MIVLSLFPFNQRGRLGPVHDGKRVLRIVKKNNLDTTQNVTVMHLMFGPLKCMYLLQHSLSEQLSSLFTSFVITHIPASESLLTVVNGSLCIGILFFPTLPQLTPNSHSLLPSRYNVILYFVDILGPVATL